MKKTLLAALGLAASLGLLAGVGAAAGKPFKIASTLDGKTVLPHRIRWFARPTLPSAQIEEVDFLIDGRVSWIEHQTPYAYSDNHPPNYSYLVTSFLAAGMHRFTVRAIASDGRKATETVRARVLPAPEPPAALAGTWQRTVDAAAAPKPGSAGNPTSTFTPSGTYRMTFEKRWVRDKFPGDFVYPKSNDTGNGFVFLDDYTAGPTLIHVVGEVVFHPVSDKLAEGGWWCYGWGPPADYTWSASGDTLTLTPVGGHDACGIRGFIWTGRWTRVR
jgi:hypothetical protein